MNAKFPNLSLTFASYNFKKQYQYEKDDNVGLRLGRFRIAHVDGRNRRQKGQRQEE